MSVWVEAARPRTLPLSIAPVLVGTAASGLVSALRFLGALVVSVGLQLGVNLANDYFDARKGVDTPDRIGPRRVTAAGLVTPQQMRRAISLVFAIASVSGASLALAVGPELLIVGLLCILAALAYSGGPKPYASAGLGEVFVFIFFGLAATAGSAYVQVEEPRALFFVAGIPVGLLACAVLVVNNLRDITTDARAGKKTLAVRLGRKRTTLLYEELLGGALLSVLLVVWLDHNAWALLPLLSTAVAWDPVRRVHNDREPRDLVEALGSTVRLYVGVTALLAIGLAVG